MNGFAYEQSFFNYESNVRSYCRAVPKMFRRAKAEYIWDIEGNRYLDALSGSGSLNYGHNNALIKQKLIDYISEDGVLQSLDFYTEEKERFLLAVQRLLLLPKGHQYKLQFTSPAGVNAVEAAIKLARFTTGRHNIVHFSNSFHGMSVGTLALTDIEKRRKTAGVPLSHGFCAPFCDVNQNPDSALKDFFNLNDRLAKASDRPAAVIVEVVQGEGGMNAANPEWLRGICDFCRQHDIPLIVDDIQSGCGRSGAFFGFEDFGIRPDIVCISKSISGFGIPFAFLLVDPHLDQQPPGHNTGTFRGNNHAFVCARAMLETYWSTPEHEIAFRSKAEEIRNGMKEIVAGSRHRATLTGKGMMIGLRFDDAGQAELVQQRAIGRRIIIERCGPDSRTVKIMLPLTVGEEATEEFLLGMKHAFS